MFAEKIYSLFSHPIQEVGLTAFYHSIHIFSFYSKAV